MNTKSKFHLNNCGSKKKKLYLVSRREINLIMYLWQGSEVPGGPRVLLSLNRKLVI